MNSENIPQNIQIAKPFGYKIANIAVIHYTEHHTFCKTGKSSKNTMVGTTNKQNALQILRRCEVFLGLSDDDLERIVTLPSVRMLTFSTGQRISKEGDPAENICILVDGKVDLRMNIQLDLASPSQEITIDKVTKGSVFHWSALVRPYVLSRTSVCTQECTILCINGKELIGLMDDNHHIGYEVMQSISAVVASRLRTPNNYFWAESLRRNKSTKAD